MLRLAVPVRLPISLADGAGGHPDDDAARRHIMVFRDDAAGPGHRPGAHFHRRDEHGVAADEGALADGGGQLVAPVEVGRDRAGADVDVLFHHGITQVRHMIEAHPRAHFRAHQLHEVPDAHLIRHVHPVAQAGERPDRAALADDHTRFNDGAGLDRRVLADDHAVVDERRRGIDDRHPVVEVALENALPDDPGRPDQLGPRVDAQGFGGFLDPRRLELGAFATGQQGHRLGQIPFFLDGAGLHLGQDLEQRLGLDADRPDVDLPDRALQGVGVGFLDDPADHADGVAHDAPIAAGVGQVGGQQRAGGVGFVVRLDEPLDRRAADQERVGVKDQQIPGEAADHALGRYHGIPGPQRRFLDDQRHFLRQIRLDRLRRLASQHHDGGLPSA